MYVLHLSNCPTLIFCTSLGKIQIYFSIVRNIMPLMKNNKTLTFSEAIKTNDVMMYDAPLVLLKPMT
jgi:hypothetical protein